MHRRQLLLGLMSAAALTGPLSPLPALAAREAPRDAAFLAGLMRSHILPRFDAFAGAAERYATKLAGFAASPTAAGLEESREAHRAVTDAWNGVQHLRPGPLMSDLRAERISFWPERPGVVQRQISQILQSRDPKVLEPGALVRQSAAVQGLTVLERLLFDDGVTAASFDGDEGKRFRGALAAAVGRNLATLAADARSGWKAMEEPLAAGKQTILGPDATFAANALFTSAITAVQVITDQKLLAPLGAKLEEARPTVAESLRSGRSTRNVVLNLEALRALMLGENGGPGFASLLPDSEDGRTARQALDESFATAIAMASAIPAPINVVVTDPAKRKSVEQAMKAIKLARVEILGTAAPLLDISIGFNELDGD